VIRIATDDPTWGHRRVPGELLTLGHRIAASTVWQILQDARINPAPRRAGPTWRQLLAAQARGIRAAGFVHVDTVLLRRTCARIVIGHGTRRAHLAGVTARPDGSWTTQAARTFLTGLGQRAACLKFLIRDRAGPFTGSFDAVFAADGTTIVPSPPGAHRERRRRTDDRHFAPRGPRPAADRRRAAPAPGHWPNTCTTTTHSARTAPWARCHRLKPTPGHRRSTSPSTGPAASRSSAASRTSIRSPLDIRALYDK
jgi:hypothetical protein